MKKFKKYVKKFDFNNEKINHKYFHSLRVKKISIYLAKKLKVNNEDLVLAEYIGLYHDIGRFNQIKKINSYNDLKLDHADEGYKILKKGKFLKRFTKEEKDIILFSIKNHNKYDISKTNSERKLFHTKLIRDADKIDILKSASTKEIFDFNKLEYKISSETNKTFYKEKLVKKGMGKTEDDILIKFFCLIFDINFDETFKYLKKKKILEKIYINIKNKKYYKEYFDYLNNYIEKRLKNVR